MKKIVLLSFFFLTYNYVDAGDCSCGSFQSGIYEYDIVAGTGGCCSGFPSGVGDERHGYFLTYTENEGVWELENISAVNPSDAQSRCCPNNS